MTIWKKTVSMTATAALLASLFVTTIGAGSVFGFTAPCDATYPEGANGTSYQFCSNVTERPADGTSYIVLNWMGANSATGATLVQVSVTGGTFINGAGDFTAGIVGSFPRTSALVTGAAPVTIAAGSQLWLASSTAGTATVSVNYSTGVTTYDSTVSYTFTSASVNVPSTALSTTNLYNGSVSTGDLALNKVSSPASAPKAAGTGAGFRMATKVLDNNGKVITSGVTVEWTISGPAYFQTSTGTNYKTSATADAVTGIAQSFVVGQPNPPNDLGLIGSTGAGGVATITTTVKYLGVSYALGDKVINFVGDPTKIECTNSYYSIATGTNQEGTDDGAFECVVTDANGFAITTGAPAFTSTSPTPAAFWTPSGVNSYSTKWVAWEVGAACGSTAGTASAIIKVTIGTKSVSTAAPLSLTCATALNDAGDKGTLAVDTTAGTTVQPGGQLAILVLVKDKNGLPAPDGTVTTAATNGFGTIVRVIRASNTKGTVDGVARYIYLAPSTPGTAVVTFFAEGNTTPSNVSVTIGVGQAATQPIPVSVKAGLPSQGGTYGTATPVVGFNKYISWRGVGGAAYAGQTVYIWTATKNNAGVWGPWAKLTSRIADATGTVYFNWRSATAAWVSVRFGNTDLTVASVARQGRWR